MAFTYQRQIGAATATSSTSVNNVAVGAAGVPIGALVVVVMMKSIAMTPSVTDTKGNTYTVHEQRNEPVDSKEIAIASAVITVALVSGDNVRPTFGGTFSEKSWQVHEFRAGGAISFEQATGAVSTFPHATQSAGVLTDTTGNLVVAGFVQNAAAATWTPGAGFTALAAQDAGATLAYGQYDLDGGGAAHLVTADSSVDAANAGVCACWAEAGGAIVQSPAIARRPHAGLTMR